MPDLRPINVLQGMISLAVLCVLLVFALAALQPFDGLSSTLETRLIVGLILIVPITFVLMLVLNLWKPDLLYGPLERGGKVFGDQRQPQTRIRVMREPPKADETQPGIPRAPGRKRIAGPKQ